MTTHPLRALLFFLFFISFTPASWGQKIKVNRIKGNQAVVEISGGRLLEGRVYEISSDSFAETSSTARNHVIALGATLSNTKSDAANASNNTEISLSGKFGWNSGTFEYGPQGSYSSIGAGGATTTVLNLGVFADYNLTPNNPGETFLYGLGGTFDLGQADNGSGTKTDLMGFFVGPFAKWFPTGSPVGFRFEAGYVYSKRSATGGDVTITGISSNLALMAYF